jgi:hypothetical protein
MAPPPSSAPPTRTAPDECSRSEDNDDGSSELSSPLPQTNDNDDDDDGDAGEAGTTTFERMRDLLEGGRRRQAARGASQVRGAALTRRSSDLGESLLHLACAAGASLCARRLLANGADPALRDSIGGGTPLHSVSIIVVGLLAFRLMIDEFVVRCVRLPMKVTLMLQKFYSLPTISTLMHKTIVCFQLSIVFFILLLLS